MWVLLQFGLFIGAFFVLFIISAIIFKDLDGRLLLGIIVMSLIATEYFFVVIMKSIAKKRETKVKLLLMSDEKRLRTANALCLQYGDCKKEIDICTDVSTFLRDFSLINEALIELLPFQYILPELSITMDGKEASIDELISLWNSEEFVNWKIRDFTERACRKIDGLISYKFKNSKSLQQENYESFEKEMTILQNNSLCNEESREYIDENLRKIRKTIGLESSRNIEDCSTVSGILYIDSLDGVEFENWCMELLKKNGFSEVRSTPVTGDQGVDILCEKDDIKFAIQCKCYSSPLGNTPVQEVFAGKQFYKCQIGVVMTNSTFTPGAIEAAAATGVLLWDKTKLEKMMKKN